MYGALLFGKATCSREKARLGLRPNVLAIKAPAEEAGTRANYFHFATEDKTLENIIKILNALPTRPFYLHTHKTFSERCFIMHLQCMAMGCNVPSPSTHTMCASAFDKVSLEKTVQLGSCQ